MTVLELVHRASARLGDAGLCFGHGTTNALDEAAWLVLWRLGLPLDDLDGVAERSVAPAAQLQVDALVAERIGSRRPAAYLTGEAWLQGVPFFVDERVIVPRSLIAEPLAEGLIDAWLGDAPPVRVLDLCTGNGSLAVLAALAWPQAAVDASELSADALAVAQRNVQRHGLAERIASRKPAAYLTGEAWLQGVPFTVDERAIVPRSLIAEPLADGTLDSWLAPRTRRVLDLCTGNGSLAVLAALAWPEVTVDATDVSADALAVAAINVERHGLGGRITLRRGDALKAAAGAYDLILCNPPYVNQASMAALPAEYRAEPALALAGGVDGLDFIRRLLRAAPAHMSENAVLVLEIGNEKPFFDAAFPRCPAVWLPTSAGDEQVLLITRSDLLNLP